MPPLNGIRLIMTYLLVPVVLLICGWESAGGGRSFGAAACAGIGGPVGGARHQGSCSGAPRPQCSGREAVGQGACSTDAGEPVLPLVIVAGWITASVSPAFPPGSARSSPGCLWVRRRLGGLWRRTASSPARCVSRRNAGTSVCDSGHTGSSPPGYAGTSCPAGHCALPLAPCDAHSATVA